MVSTWTETWSFSLWAEFKSQIDENNPVILLVNSSGNGISDHFVTAIGYS